MKPILKDSIKKSLRVVFSMYNLVLTFIMIAVEIIMSRDITDYISIIINNTIIFFLIPFVISSIAIYIIYLVDRRKIKIEKENESYYRDILKEITPVELSYIDDYGIELEKDIVATLLSLQLRKKVEITNENINILDKNTNKLLCHEKFVVDRFLENEKYHYNDKKLLFNKKFQKELMKDLNNSEIVYYKDEKSIFSKLLTKNLLILMLAIVLIMEIFVHGVIKRNNIGLFKIIYIVFLIGYQIFVNRFHIRRLTPKGKEIKYKLHGLKLFLKDYSDMKSKNINELGLWDEYMIYSVILENNKKVKKQVMKIIKKYFY